MVTIESIKFEYKAGAVLGGIALVLSVIVGLAAGNTFVYSFGRAVFLGIVFALLGAGLIILLKKYVPELFEITVSVDSGAGGQVAAADAGNGGSSFSAGVTVADGSSAGVSAFDSSAGSSGGTGEQGFVPLGEYVAGQNSLGDEHLQTKGREKLGKHYLQDKKGMKFEPKILAEAIRTMMSKDQ